MTLNDILLLDSEFDYRDRVGIHQQLRTNEQVQAIKRQIELATAVFMGNVGSKSEKGYKAFSRWESRKRRELSRLMGYETMTVWDTVKKGSKKI